MISQIEFFVYLAVKFRYRKNLPNVLGIAWIDNEAARFVAIKGTSDSFSMMSMNRVVQQIEQEMPSSVWLQRVSSFSNPSDMPSRKQVTSAAELFGATPCGLYKVLEILVEAILSLHEEPYALLNALTQGVISSA